MKKILLLLLALLMLACNRTKHNSASDHAYSMLERVAELNAEGDKHGALALADSALRMHPADTTRCWLLSEKAVTLVDMGAWRIPSAWLRALTVWQRGCMT